jgi:LysM repeat protein
MKRFSRTVLAVLLSWMALSVTSIHLAAAQNGDDYVVKPGDTLLAIAQQFGASASAIQSANNLKNPDALQIGQTLRIPGGQGPATEAAAHVVQAGDTLLAIGLQYGVSIGELTRANNISDSSVLQIGQRLVIPGKAAAATAQQAQAAPVELIPLVPIAPAQADATQAQAQLQPEPTPIPLAAATAAEAGVDVEVETLRAQLLAYYNQQRVAAGLQPLAYSFVLQTSAQGQADDCAGRGSCSHFGSDGSRSSQRIARAGYPGRITGENWAWARTAARAWEMWYTEEIPDGPHLLNIMSPRYAEVGFGIARAKGGFYMLANFGG